MDIQPADGALFSFLEAADQEYLLGVGVSRRYVANEVLLRQGDPGDHVLLVVSGWVRVYSTRADGQEVVLALRGPGDVLGDLAALHGWDRTASVQALGAVSVSLFRRQQFVDSLYAKPTIAIAMIKQMSTRLREAELVTLDFANQDVSRRVAGFLSRFMSQHGTVGPDGVELSMPLTHQDIANRVGASPRAVARAMSLLRERGIVVTARRRIVILRPDVLRSFAGYLPNGS